MQIQQVYTGASPLVGSASPASGSSVESFDQAFASAFTTALETMGINPGTFQVTAGGTGTNRQIIVNYTLPGNNSPMAPATATPGGAATGGGAATPTSGTAGGASTPASGTAGGALNPAATSTLPAAAGEAASAAPATGSSGTSGTATSHWYAPDAADDAYWNAQPAAVQQLREMTSLSQREALAANLEGQGYKIDVPVMVWGWDAAKTTAMREQYGYTWIPAMGQAPVQEAPGANLPGLTPYDPNHPPPGSILVPPAGSAAA